MVFYSDVFFRWNKKKFTQRKYAVCFSMTAFFRMVWKTMRKASRTKGLKSRKKTFQLFTPFHFSRKVFNVTLKKLFFFRSTIAIYFLTPWLYPFHQWIFEIETKNRIQLQRTKLQYEKEPSYNKKKSSYMLMQFFTIVFFI